MSEFLAEAQVLIRPDTTKFRAELEAELLAATKGLSVPIPVLAAPAQGAATQAAAKAANEEAKASQRIAGARSVQQAATNKATAASRLLAQAETQLAEVETIASLRTTKLSQARARLSETGSAAAIAARAVAAAEASGNTALIEATRNTLALAEAQELQARAGVRSAIANEKLAASQAKQARSSAFAARGAGATALSLAGARGATLAANSAFLVGAAGAVFLAKSLEQATDAEEVFRRTTLLMGEDIANQMAASSEEISRAFGIDDEDVLRFQVQVGQIFKVVGLADKQTVEFSENIVKLAADMAAFAGVPVATTLKAIQGGLAGNTRGLKTYGILLTNAAVQQEAMERTGKRNTDELTRAELVTARYNLILQDASFQQGAFADQSGRLTGQSKILRVNFENLQETIGKGLVPAVTGLVKGLNETFDSFNQAKQGAQDLAGSLPILGDEVAGVNLGGLVEDATRLRFKMLLLGPTAVIAAEAFDRFRGSTKDAAEELDIFDRIAGKVATTLGGVSNALDTAVSKLPKAKDIIEVDIAVARARGDTGSELAGLRQQEAAQDAFLKRILERPQSRKNLALAEKAANQLEATRAEIQAILDQQDADDQALLGQQEAAARDAASKAAAAASKIEAEREKANDAFLDALLGKRGRAENLILRAGRTEGLQDDINLTKAFENILRQQIEQVRRRVKAGLTNITELRALTTLLIQTVNEGKRLRQEQAAALKEAAAARLDKVETSIRLDVELADINESTNRRIALRLKLIAQLKKEAKTLKLTGNALKENRNEIARINAEIRAINEENKKAVEQSKEGFSAFEFLQKQQGFAANLLGNLIPGFATAGLVGGSQSQPDNVVSPTAKLQASAGASRVSGPTFGQAATEVDILKEMLRVLRAISAGRAAPEAGFQRSQMAAVMDGIGGGGGGGQSVS